MEASAVPPLDVLLTSDEFLTAPVENKVAGINNAFEFYSQNQSYTPEQHFEVRNKVLDQIYTEDFHKSVQGMFESPRPPEDVDWARQRVLEYKHRADVARQNGEPAPTFPAIITRDLSEDDLTQLTDRVMRGEVIKGLPPSQLQRIDARLNEMGGNPFKVALAESAHEFVDRSLQDSEDPNAVYEDPVQSKLAFQKAAPALRALDGIGGIRNDEFQTKWKEVKTSDDGEGSTLFTVRKKPDVSKNVWQINIDGQVIDKEFDRGYTPTPDDMNLFVQDNFDKFRADDGDSVTASSRDRVQALIGVKNRGFLDEFGNIFDRALGKGVLGGISGIGTGLAAGQELVAKGLGYASDDLYNAVSQNNLFKPLAVAAGTMSENLMKELPRTSEDIQQGDGFSWDGSVLANKVGDFTAMMTPVLAMGPVGGGTVLGAGSASDLMMQAYSENLEKGMDESEAFKRASISGTAGGAVIGGIMAATGKFIGSNTFASRAIQDLFGRASVGAAERGVLGRIAGGGYDFGVNTLAAAPADAAINVVGDAMNQTVATFANSLATGKDIGKQIDELYGPNGGIIKNLPDNLLLGLGASSIFGNISPVGRREGVSAIQNVNGHQLDRRFPVLENIDPNKPSWHVMLDKGKDVPFATREEAVGLSDRLKKISDLRDEFFDVDSRTGSISPKRDADPALVESYYKNVEQLNREIESKGNYESRPLDEEALSTHKTITGAAEEIKRLSARLNGVEPIQDQRNHFVDTILEDHVNRSRDWEKARTSMIESLMTEGHQRPTKKHDEIRAQIVENDAKIQQLQAGRKDTDPVSPELADALKRKAILDDQFNKYGVTKSKPFTQENAERHADNWIKDQKTLAAEAFRGRAENHADKVFGTDNVLSVGLDNTLGFVVPTPELANTINKRFSIDRRVSADGQSFEYDVKIAQPRLNTFPRARGAESPVPITFAKSGTKYPSVPPPGYKPPGQSRLSAAVAADDAASAGLNVARPAPAEGYTPAAPAPPAAPEAPQRVEIADIPADAPQEAILPVSQGSKKDPLPPFSREKLNQLIEGVLTRKPIIDHVVSQLTEGAPIPHSTLTEALAAVRDEFQKLDRLDYSHENASLKGSLNSMAKEIKAALAQTKRKSPAVDRVIESAVAETNPVQDQPPGPRIEEVIVDQISQSHNADPAEVKAAFDATTPDEVMSVVAEAQVVKNKKRGPRVRKEKTTAEDFLTTLERKAKEKFDAEKKAKPETKKSPPTDPIEGAIDEALKSRPKMNLSPEDRARVAEYARTGDETVKLSIEHKFGAGLANEVFESLNPKKTDADSRREADALLNQELKKSGFKQPLELKKSIAELPPEEIARQEIIEDHYTEDGVTTFTMNDGDSISMVLSPEEVADLNNVVTQEMYDSANDRIEDLVTNLASRASMLKAIKDLHSKGLIDDISMSEATRISKDKDMDGMDLVDGISIIQPGSPLNAAAIKGLNPKAGKRTPRSKQGSTVIFSEVADLAMKAIKGGVDFVKWSGEMAKNFGAAFHRIFKEAWSSVSGGLAEATSNKVPVNEPIIRQSTDGGKLSGDLEAAYARVVETRKANISRQQADYLVAQEREMKRLAVEGKLSNAQLNQMQSDWTKSSNTFAEGVKANITPLLSRFEDVHPSLRPVIANYMFDHMTMQKFASDLLDPLHRVLRSMDKDSQMDFLLAQRAGDQAGIAKALSASKEKDAFKIYTTATKDAFPVLLNNMRARGIEVGEVKDFFPSRVKDINKLRDELIASGLSEDHYLNEVKNAEKKNGAPLTDEQRSWIIGQALRRHMGRGPNDMGSSLKSRKVDKITQIHMNNYELPSVALEKYVVSYGKNMARAKFFGNDVDTVANNYRQGETSYNDNLKTTLKGSVIGNAITKAGLNAQQTAEVRRLIQTELEYKADSGPVKFLKAGNVMFALAKFETAVTQPAAEIVMSVFHNGLKSNFISAKNIGNADRITFESIGLTHNTEIGGQSGAFKRLDDTLMKYSGFKYMDRLPGEIALNAHMHKLQGMSEEALIRELLPFQEYKLLIEGSAEDLAKRIKRGDFSGSDARFVAFNALSKIRPVGLASMPENYLKYNNYGRILYNMRSWSVFQLDNAYRSSIKQIMKGDTDSISKGLKGLAGITGGLILTGASQDSIKDWLYGRPVNFGDAMMDNLFKLALTSRYQLTEATNKGPVPAVFEKVANTPLLSVINSLWKTTEKAIDAPEGEKLKQYWDDTRLMSSIPFAMGVGKVAQHIWNGDSQADSVMRRIEDHYPASIKAHEELQAPLRKLGLDGRKKAGLQLEWDRLQDFTEIKNSYEKEMRAELSKDRDERDLGYVQSLANQLEAIHQKPNEWRSINSVRKQRDKEIKREEKLK